jgi:primosomal protein N' (replication factor Y)
VTARLVDVALPLPLQRAFTYRVPDTLAVPERGARVVVPFGRRRSLGVALGPPAAAPPEAVTELKEILEVADARALPSPALLDLAAWMADYYLGAPGLCYRLVMPPSGLPVARTSGPGFRLVRWATLEDVPGDLEGGQAEVVGRLRAAGGRQSVPDLVRDRPSLRAALARLVQRGAVRVADEREVRQPRGLPAGDPVRVEPTGDQQVVLDALLGRAAGFQPFLLHGVTGSGKTEVYFRAAERMLEQGRGVVVLVPEIALTPMLARAVAGRFGGAGSVLHSGLSAGERHDQWWRIHDGEARVVVGARSAVFAPVAPLGLIVVDEEHEAAYKQEEAPRYHGRDVAVMRAKLEGVAVVLGSATPSLESYANAVRGKYRLLGLPERIGERRLPRVEVIDRREALRSGADPVLTPELREALAARLERGEQSLLLLNRRGWATSLLCRECGREAACPNCSVSLVLHHGGRRAECHYCGHQVAAPSACSFCSGVYLRLRGYGTEKVVEAVRDAFPRARVDRLDRDRARRRGTAEKVLAAFEAGALDVLVGTQMIAKGHDFPRVTLVGVVDADVGLGMPDFRAAERTFQLLTQMAGRAGRGDQEGEVLLQSHLPDHYALRLACTHDYRGFFEHEMEFRRTMAYPPSAALLNVIVRAAEEEPARREADWLARALRGRAAGRFRVLGPAAAPLARIKGEHRMQVLLKGDRPSLREAVRRALTERYGEARWPGITIDVDPVSLM